MEEVKMAESKSKESKGKAPEAKEAKSKETKSDVKAVKESKKIFNETLTAVWIDKLLDKLRKGYFSDFLEKNERRLVATGLFGLYIAAVLGLLASFVLSIRYTDVDSASTIGFGVIWFFLCIIIHYTAWKFLPALSHLIQNTPTKLSSKSFLDSLALLAGIAGVISLTGGLLWGLIGGACLRCLPVRICTGAMHFCLGCAWVLLGILRLVCCPSPRRGCTLCGPRRHL